MKKQLSILCVLFTSFALSSCASPEEKAEPVAEEISEAKQEVEPAANKPPTEEVQWGYGEEAGPQKWGELAPEFAMCALGKNQSPIDFSDVLMSQALADPVVTYTKEPSELVHKGYALQANYPSGNEMVVTDDAYELLQLHFHAPGEHTVAGREYPLEAHFVHQDPDGNLAVLGVLFSQGPENAELAKLLENVPTEKGQQVSLEGAGFDATKMLPTLPDHYRYNGSLTTPPCSEGVRFFILEEAVTASAEQIAKIRDAVGHPNARPVQPTNARVIVR